MSTLYILVTITIVISIVMFYYLKQAKSKVIAEYGEFIVLSPPPEIKEIDNLNTGDYLKKTYEKVSSSVDKTGLFCSISFAMLLFCGLLNLLVLTSAAVKISFTNEIHFENIITFFSLGGSAMGGYVFFSFFKYLNLSCYITKIT